jgi:hypothetical protein
MTELRRGRVHCGRSMAWERADALREEGEGGGGGKDWAGGLAQPAWPLGAKRPGGLAGH